MYWRCLSLVARLQLKRNSLHQLGGLTHTCTDWGSGPPSYYHASESRASAAVSTAVVIKDSSHSWHGGWKRAQSWWMCVWAYYFWIWSHISKTATLVESIHPLYYFLGFYLFCFLGALISMLTEKWSCTVIWWFTHLPDIWGSGSGYECWLRTSCVAFACSLSSHIPKTSMFG